MGRRLADTTGSPKKALITPEREGSEMDVVTRDVRGQQRRRFLSQGQMQNERCNKRGRQEPADVSVC